MKTAVIILTLTTALICFSCKYDKHDTPEPPAARTVTANTTISSLAGLYVEGGVTINEDIVIKGTVTTSDSCGNFYKCVMIQDETGAAELRLGLYDLYTLYHPGQTVYVNLKGLAIGLYNGSLQVGIRSAAGSAYEVDYINSSPVIGQHLTKGSESSPPSPIRLSIPEITPSHLGMLVEIHGASFTQGGKQTWSGEKTFSEKRGVSILVYTNDYATFAGDILPEGKIILRGIVTQYRDKLQIKISSPEDAIPDPD